MTHLASRANSPPHTPLRRRRLWFRSLDEITADVEMLRRHQVAQLGNWSLGQICKHLATGMHLSIDGGEELRTQYPWWQRLLGPLFKHYVLWFGLHPGYRLKGEPARVLIPEPMETAEGARELAEAVRRLQGEPRRVPRHVLGRFSRAQWDCYHCRHAELHLSFIVPLGKATT